MVVYPPPCWLSSQLRESLKLSWLWQGQRRSDLAGLIISWCHCFGLIPSRYMCGRERTMCWMVLNVGSP